MELVFPPELEPCFAHGIIPEIGGRVSLGQVGGMSGELKRDYSFLYIVPVG